MKLKTPVKIVNENPQNESPYKSLEKVEFFIHDEQDYESENGIILNLPSNLKITPMNKENKDIIFSFHYKLLQNEIVMPFWGEVLDMQMGCILNKYLENYQKEVLTAGEADLIKQYEETGEELPNNFKPVSSLKIFMETIIYNINEFICRLIYATTITSIYKALDEFSYDDVNSWINILFDNPENRDKILSIKTKKDGTPLEYSVTTLGIMIKLIYEDYIKKDKFDSAIEKLNHSVNTIFNLVDTIANTVSYYTDNKDDIAGKIIDLFNDIPSYEKKTKQVAKNSPESTSLKLNDTNNKVNSKESSVLKLSFDLTGIPTMSEDGTKPLTALERMYIKNEEVIRKYEDILFSTVYYCYYNLNAGDRMFEYLYGRLDYINNNLRDNLKELFNSSPYRSHLDDWHLNYLNGDDKYELSYIEDILWDEIKAYGRLENEKGDAPVISKEERDKLFSKALLVVSLIAFDSLRYKIRHPFEEVNTIDLSLKTLRKIQNIELVKYDMKVLFKEDNDKEKDKMIDSIDRDNDKITEIMEVLADTFSKYTFADQDLVEIIVDRFERETNGKLSENEITDIVYLPSGTVKIITPHKLSEYMYVPTLKKYNIDFSIGSYFKSLYEILKDYDIDDDDDDDCRYRWTWRE